MALKVFNLFTLHNTTIFIIHLKISVLGAASIVFFQFPVSISFCQSNIHKFENSKQ